MFSNNNKEEGGSGTSRGTSNPLPPCSLLSLLSSIYHVHLVYASFMQCNTATLGYYNYTTPTTLKHWERQWVNYPCTVHVAVTSLAPSNTTIINLCLQHQWPKLCHGAGCAHQWVREEHNTLPTLADVGHQSRVDHSKAFVCTTCG